MTMMILSKIQEQEEEGTYFCLGRLTLVDDDDDDDDDDDATTTIVEKEKGLRWVMNMTGMAA